MDNTIAQKTDDGAAKGDSLNLLKIFDNPFMPIEESSLEPIPGMQPIRGFDNPDGWDREIKECGFDRSSCSVNFRPPDGSDSTLSFFDRGFPVVGSGAEKFRQLMAKQSHVLNAAEIDGLTEQVLGPLADKSAFKVSHAETKELNGKKVLALDGEWTSGKKFHGYFIPAPDHHIREMYFEGDSDGFNLNLRNALNAIQSIQWLEESK